MRSTQVATTIKKWRGREGLEPIRIKRTKSPNQLDSFSSIAMSYFSPPMAINRRMLLLSVIPRRDTGERQKI